MTQTSASLAEFVDTQPAAIARSPVLSPCDSSHCDINSLMGKSWEVTNGKARDPGKSAVYGMKNVGEKTLP